MIYRIKASSVVLFVFDTDTILFEGRPRKSLFLCTERRRRIRRRGISIVENTKGEYSSSISGIRRSRTKGGWPLAPPPTSHLQLSEAQTKFLREFNRLNSSQIHCKCLHGVSRELSSLFFTHRPSPRTLIFTFFSFTPVVRLSSCCSGSG